MRDTSRIRSGLYGRVRFRAREKLRDYLRGQEKDPADHTLQPPLVVRKAPEICRALESPAPELSFLEGVKYWNAPGWPTVPSERTGRIQRPSQLPKLCTKQILTEKKTHANADSILQRTMAEATESEPPQ